MPDTAFNQWLRQVDDHIADYCGLSHDDLADIDYRSLYEGDTLPLDAAHEALVEGGMGELLIPTL